MNKARWNFRLGPIQFSSAFGVLSLVFVAVVVLICCCGAWVVGASNG